MAGKRRAGLAGEIFLCLDRGTGIEAGIQCEEPILALTLALRYLDYGDGQIGATESMRGMVQVVQSEVDTLLAAVPAARQAQLDSLHDAFIALAGRHPARRHQPLRCVARYHDVPADTYA